MVSEGTIMLWFKVSVWLKIILFSKAINGSKKEHHAFPTIPSAPTWLTDQAHTRYFRIISLNSHKEIYYSLHQEDINALRGQTFGKYVLWAWNIIINLEYGFINRSMPLLHFMIWEIITIINKKWSFSKFIHFSFKCSVNISYLTKMFSSNAFGSFSVPFSSNLIFYPSAHLASYLPVYLLQYLL